MLARSLVGQTYQHGAMIVRQGEIGSMFFVIERGEINVTINGAVIRTLGQKACFGERALLFDEPRTASIQVVSQEAEIWAVDKEVFSKIVSGNLRQHLLERIRLQDTSVELRDLRHVEVVGVGGQGVVRLVEHVAQGQRYALKRVDKDSGRIPKEVERERSLLAETDHPFIMTYVKSFETSKYVYMLTEFISGGELFDAIRTISTALSPVQAQFYIGSLVLVLEELADRHIVYRDLKPENVMLDKHGYLKLVDFGTAKKLRESERRTFTVIGTPHYLAPEVLLGKGYGLEVDIWSLGVLLFELVCGFLPFAEGADNAGEICRAVLHQSLRLPSRYKHPAGRHLIQSMLVRKPHERLGAGINGYDDLKHHRFFLEGHSHSSLFEKIMSRSLEPPVHPATGASRRMEEDIALDDCHELA